MVDNNRLLRPRDPFDRFDDAISDSRSYEPTSEAPRYRQHNALQPYESAAPQHDDGSHEPVPLFLSNPEEEDETQLPGYTFASGSRLKPAPSRLIPGALVAVAVGAILAVFSMESTRAVIFSASSGGPEPAQLAASAEPVTQPQRIAPPTPKVDFPSPPDIPSARLAPAGAMASAAPTREDIAAAYQSAAKSNVVAAEPAIREAARNVAMAPASVPVTVPEIAPPKRIETSTARRIAPDELATLLKRARSLLAIGDITSARLLLERAADAQEAEAALMLAGTYDPQVLGSQDQRSIKPDPATARRWYEKAAQLGSADARRRLGQLQN